MGRGGPYLLKPSANPIAQLSYFHLCPAFLLAPMTKATRGLCGFDMADWDTSMAANPGKTRIGVEECTGNGEKNAKNDTSIAAE